MVNQSRTVSGTRVEGRAKAVAASDAPQGVANLKLLARDGCAGRHACKLEPNYGVTRAGAELGAELGQRLARQLWACDQVGRLFHSKGAQRQLAMAARTTGARAGNTVQGPC